MSSFDERTILYLDNHLLIVNKPAGMLVQGDSTGDVSLLDHCKDFLKTKYNKPGNVFLGLVHRLDRPVSGIIVFARTSKAAARLSKQFREKTLAKNYLAILEGKPKKNNDVLQDYLARDGKKSYITNPTSGKKCILEYRVLSYLNNKSLVYVELKTGRHHQIRVQFSSRGIPIIGDKLYNANVGFDNRTIALHAYELIFEHPTTKEELHFKAFPGNSWEKYFDFKKINI